MITVPEPAHPPSISALLVAQATLGEHEREDDATERMEVDALTVSPPSGPIVNQELVGEDSTMHTSSDAMNHDALSESVSASSPIDSNMAGPRVDELALTPQHQPYGPIITPTVEPQPMVSQVTVGMGPILKHQATTSEVLMDMALIRTGIANDSATVEGDASTSSPSSASAPEASIEASVYPGPTVEMVANV